MQHNALYQLIKKYQKRFETFYTLPQRVEFFYLAPKNKKPLQIDTKVGHLTVDNYHITVFNMIKIQNSTFHITLCLSDACKKNYTVRIYYKGMGEHLFQTCEDGQQNSADIGINANLFQFGSARVSEFISVISQFSREYDESYSRYEVAISFFNNEPLPHFAPEKLGKYKVALGNMIAHIKSEDLFSANYQDKLKFYCNSLEMANKQIQMNKDAKKNNIMKSEPIGTPKKPTKAVIKSASKAPVKSKTAAKPKTDPVVVLNEQIKTLTLNEVPTFRDINEEYELQQKKLNLLDSDDDEYLDTSLRVTTLLKKIDGIVRVSVLGTDFNNDPNSDIIMGFIKKCTLSTETLVLLAVETNALSFLEKLVTLRNDINFNKKTEKGFLIEIASLKGHIKVFNFLLNHNATANIFCSNKIPILNNACHEKSIAPIKMVLDLLKAGADPRIVDITGFNALGHLVQRYIKDVDPCLSNIKAFLDYTSASYPESINQIQGPEKETLLATACRQNKPELLSLLLEFNANPNIKSLLLHSTPLGISVIEQSPSLLELIIKESKIPIKEGLRDALDVAVLYTDNSRESFKNRIIEYSDLHQLHLQLPTPKEAAFRKSKILQTMIPVTGTDNNFYKPPKQPISKHPTGSTTICICYPK